MHFKQIMVYLLLSQQAGCDTPHIPQYCISAVSYCWLEKFSKHRIKNGHHPETAFVCQVQLADAGRWEMQVTVLVKMVVRTLSTAEV